MLSDESLWIPHYSGTHESPQVGIFLTRMPAIYISDSLTNRFLRCYTASKLSKEHWFLAGNLSLIFNKGINPDFEAWRFKIPLNRITLLKIPDYVFDYQLKFETVYWLSNITISVDKFIGDINETQSNQPSQSSLADPIITMGL